MPKGIEYTEPPKVFICAPNCPVDGKEHDFSVIKQEYGTRGQVISEFGICSKCGLDEITYDMLRLP